MKVRVRMYRQGLGDCFLLSFFTTPQPVHILIDCGTLGATTTGVSMGDVVQDIRDETADHLDLLIATHEHKDHVSGFSTERAKFDEIKVDRVWVAWTENPKDELAVRVVKHRGDLLASIRLAGQMLESNQAADPDERRALGEVASGVRGLLGFYSDLPVGVGGGALAADFAKTVHEAMSYATMKSGKPPRFLLPGNVFEPSWLPGVRFYVLGPPRSEDSLNALGTHESPELYKVTANLADDLAACAKFSASGMDFVSYRDSLDAGGRQSFERRLPFDPRFRLECNAEETSGEHATYYDESEAWRRIDYDWLATASDLAMQLDNSTNNTSLVLAIELIDDERVLLLPADAQLGNWLSWQKLTWNVTDANGSKREVNATDLLRRTVFYKVGHHASHNGTVNDQGLELMQRDDLVAMIPVDGKVALNRHPTWRMPAKPLYKRLLEKTRGRVLRSDTGWPKDGERPTMVSKAEWDELRASSDITVDDLYVELRLQ